MAGLQFAPDNSGDEKSADNEKHIDTSKSPAKEMEPGVKEYYGNDGNRPEPVNLGAIATRHD